METVLVTLIIVTVVLFGALTLGYRYLAAQDATVRSSMQMEERVQERARTNLSALAATASAGDVEVTLKNVGSIKLADFERWDVVVQYYDDNAIYHAQWYPYRSGTNAWMVQGIYLSAPSVAESFEPGILNPSEEMVLRVSVSPDIGSPSTNWITVVTPNGISASTVFTR